jgi:hypothetical protein
MLMSAKLVVLAAEETVSTPKAVSNVFVLMAGRLVKMEAIVLILMSVPYKETFVVALENVKTYWENSSASVIPVMHHLKMNKVVTTLTNVYWTMVDANTTATTQWVEENAAVMRVMYLPLMEDHVLISMNALNIWTGAMEDDAKTCLDLSDVTALMVLFQLMI